MKKTIIMAFIILAAASCAKDIAPDATLKVTVDKKEYKVGEEVTFSFEGTPDNIVFYSGEYGHTYENRNNHTRVGTLFFDFKSMVRNGVIARNIDVLVSTDYNGGNSIEDVKAATWLDMSDRFTFSEGKDNTPSGELNVNDFLKEKNGSINPDDNIYFAFHYYDYQDETRAVQNEWIIRTSDVNIVAPNGERSNLATMKTMGWKERKFPAEIDATQSRILFKDLDKTAGSKSDDWTVSPAFSIGGIPADSGTPLKSISTSISEYKYTYTKPGVYKAVFETSSQWYTGGNTSLTEVEIVVTEEISGE